MQILGLILAAIYVAVAISLTNAGSDESTPVADCRGVNGAVEEANQTGMALLEAQNELRELVSAVTRRAQSGDVYIWYDEDLYFAFDDLPLAQRDAERLANQFRRAQDIMDGCVTELKAANSSPACIQTASTAFNGTTARGAALRANAEAQKSATDALREATSSGSVRNGIDPTSSSSQALAINARVREALAQYTEATSNDVWKVCFSELLDETQNGPPEAGVLRRLMYGLQRLLGYTMLLAIPPWVYWSIKHTKAAHRQSGGSRFVKRRQPFAPSEAEEAVAYWASRNGWQVLGQASGGADGGVDVETRRLVIQVKATARPIGRPIVQQILGVSTSLGKQGVVISTAGFTSAASSWASSHGVALFRLARDGIAPLNRRAEVIVGNPTNWT